MPEGRIRTGNYPASELQVVNDEVACPDCNANGKSGVLRNRGLGHMGVGAVCTTCNFWQEDLTSEQIQVLNRKHREGYSQRKGRSSL